MKQYRDLEAHQDRAALYALSALSQHEARSFEAHMRDGCQECRAELGEFQEVVVALGMSAQEAEPPAYLRDLLLARVSRELPQSHLALPQRGIAEENRPPAAASARPSLAGRIIPWAIAAGVAAVAALSLIAWQQSRQREAALAGQLAALEYETRRLDTELARQNAKANELAQINDVLILPDSSVITLAGSESAPSSSANVYWDRRNNRWLVSAELPPPPAGRVYQLWFVTPDEKISAGLIKTDDHGHGFMVIPGPANAGAVAAAITLEPEGGSPQPTLPIYAAGKVA